METYQPAVFWNSDYIRLAAIIVDWVHEGFILARCQSQMSYGPVSDAAPSVRHSNKVDFTLPLQLQRLSSRVTLAHIWFTLEFLWFYRGASSSNFEQKLDSAYWIETFSAIDFDATKP